MAEDNSKSATLQNKYWYQGLSSSGLKLRLVNRKVDNDVLKMEFNQILHKVGL